MKKILITGAGGYIGSIGTDMFLKNGYEIIGIDNFSTGFIRPLTYLQRKYGSNKFRFYKYDIKDNLTWLLKKEKNIDAVIHYAASSIIDESVKNPRKYFDNNVVGSYSLLNFILNAKIKYLIFSSSCAVYETKIKMPLKECSPLLPHSPYGESKLIIENTIKWYGKLVDLRYAILRYFNVCGASTDGELGDSRKPSTALVQNAVRGALKIEPLLFTYSKCHTHDSSPIRDFVNVIDLNDAHLKALEYLFNSGLSEVFNVGTGIGNSVLEIINKVEDLTSIKIKLKRSIPRNGEVELMIASYNKIFKVLKWKPKYTLEDSIKSLMKWYKKHPNGWNV